MTGYPLKTIIVFALDGILGFSTVPLQLTSRLCFVLSMFAFLATSWGVKVFFPAQPVRAERS